jgi:hypothetical protein
MPAATTTLRIADGTLEALKWLALMLMLLDHANTFLYERTLPGAYVVARIVAPIFSFVLAYNLARPGALERGVHRRVMQRLLAFGLLACPPFMALIGNWWPLNILFSLLAGTVIVYGVERGDLLGLALSAVTFAVSGLFVEYLYPGLAMFVTAWLLCKRPTPLLFALWVAATASIALINANGWSLLAVPLLLLAPRVELHVPRLRWVFYAFYPAHLAVLWWIQRLR